MKRPFNRFVRWSIAYAAAWGAQASAADMVITSEVPVTTNPSPYIEQFIAEVSKRTNGAIQGKYFPAAQLYNDRDALAALGTGAVHMVWPVSSRLELMDPRLGVISLPFTLGTREMTNRCFSDGFTRQISGYAEPRGVKVLGFLRTAELLFIMKSRDVQRVADLKGQKVRVVGGKVMLDAMHSVQASPVSMAASEMSAALAQGAIDGVMTSPAGWVDVLGTTAKFATLVPGMALATSAVVVDKAWFDGLPADQRTVVQTVLDEITARQWQETVTKDEQLVKKMVDQGGTYRVMPADETERLKERFVAAGQSFRDKHGDVMKQVDELRKTCL